MVFKRIEIEGFLSYYKHTEIAFSEGNTLIIGKNNTGKSKLFDAFHWGLFNRVFDSQMERWIESPDELNRMILNNRLKKEASANGDIATVAVTIVLEAEEYEGKTVTITRTNKYDFSASATPQVTSSLAFYAEDAVTGDDPYDCFGPDAQNRIAQLFPRCLRDFVLFQGEAASELMKLANKNQNTIKNAIEEISRIRLFQRATEIAESYRSSVERKLNKAVKLSKENQRELTTLEKDKTDKENEIQSLKEQNTFESDIADLSGQYDELRSELSQYEEIDALFKDRDKYKREYKEASEELKKCKEVHKEVSNTWIFYKVRDKLASFSDFYNSLESKGHVPPPIPQTEIKASLKNHTCALCGNHLDEGSDCYRNVKAKERNDIIDRFGKVVGKISFAINMRLSAFENVPRLIKEYIDNSAMQESARDAALQKVKEAEGKLRSIQLSDADFKAKEAFNSKRRHLQEIEKALNEKRREKHMLEGCIQQLNKEINQIRHKMSELLSQAEEINENDRIKLAYAERIVACMKNLFDSVQDTAYEEIQKETNSYYHEMAKENPAIIGDIKIDRENSKICAVNTLGEEIRDLNTGNRILIQLAVIAGILSVASRQFDMIYPFVTDAPTSQLDATNKMQTIKCMLRAFDQSLIIVKDDSEKGNEGSDPLRRLIFESKGIGAAYELALVVDSEDSLIEDQYTVVNVLKECSDEL